MDHPLLKEARESLQSRYLDELKSIPPGDLTAVGVHARIIALEDVFNHLKSIVNDDKVARHRSVSPDKKWSSP
jgi:hypothetical protein